MAVSSFLTLPAHAVAPAAPEIRIDPTTLYFGAATAPPAAPVKSLQASPPPAVSRAEVPEALRQKAAQGGPVRVIVQLAAPFRPEGRLSSSQALDQKQAIGRVQDTVLGKLAGQRFKLHARYEHIPFLALEVDAKALDVLSRTPEVVAVEQDVLDKASLINSEVSIGVGVAWSQGLTGAGQTVAILDTGVDKTHPFFNGGGHAKVVSEACYSSNVTGYTTTVCPGGVEESTAPGSGVNCSSFECIHGTHVAGIAAANDGGTNFGVARDADLISIQVFSDVGYTVGAWTSDQVKGLERVFALADQYNIAAVNMSLGGGGYSDQAACDADNAARKAAIDNLRSLDIATVVAAGNDYYPYGLAAPACISSAVSVGATDDSGTLANFSDLASFLSLLAPGVAVESSVPGGGTQVLSGTSMAAPHVTGSWAILRQQSPQATVTDLLRVLRNTGDPNHAYGYDLRRINLGRAVTGGPFDNHSFTIYNDGTAILSVLSMQLETPASWIHWTPEAPFDIAPGGSREVSVSVDLGTAPDGVSMNRLIVGSNDADENPYPDAVHLVIDKEPCYLLTRTRTGSGGYPAAVPSSSAGCPAGEFRAGEVIQLTAQPATGWSLQSWSGTDNDGSTAATNTLTMPAAPHTVDVTYFTPCWALTLAHTGSGGNPVASPANSPGCPAGQYKYGEPIQVTASPASGWRVGSWVNTSADASHGIVNTLTMPLGDTTVTVNYLEGLINVLLVSGDSYVESYYTAALDAAGIGYDLWSIDSQGEPNASTLSAYPRVVWNTGPYGALYSGEETALSTYLDGGGALFVPSQDYIYDRGGATPFMVNYLGLGSYYSDFEYYQVTGQGDAFGGLGPYNLQFFNWPNYTDLLAPAAGAQLAFSNSYGGAGVSKIGSSYRTIFLGFPLEALPTPEGRRDVMKAALDYLATVFADVPPKYWARKWIEAVFRAGVTTGCAQSPRQYCPEDVVTRGSMAPMLIIAKEGPGYVPPPCAVSPFSDVPAASPLCPWIQELVQRGVTSGCGGGQYCPNSPVTRSQMAVFLLSAWHGPGYSPAACTASGFSDVSSGSPFCPWIQEMAVRGITAGCGGGAFCTESPNTRAQLAVFLATTFGLPLQ
ncbi:MAG: S8 family serine peptidase [Thermoanaerobaculia bacterium]